MSALTLLAVGCVGGVGACARLLLDGTVSPRFVGPFPYGTLLVNVSGSFVLGLLVGIALEGDAYRIAGVGLIGAFTTFSTWMFESHRLGEDGQARLAAVNVVVALVLGVSCAWVGRKVGLAL